MTIFFMHITKTAGGSLKEALRTSEADVLFHYPDEPGFNRQFSYDHFPDIVFGHYLFGAHTLAGLPPRYAAFFRDPVARTVSHFHHLKNNDLSPLGDLARQHETVEQFVTQSPHWEFDNFLCRVVSGVGNKCKFGDSGYNMYSKARNNLASCFEFVGIFEQMEDSVARFRRAVADVDLDLPTVNKGSYKKEIDPSVERLLRSLNAFDYLLYEDALRQAGY